MCLWLAINCIGLDIKRASAIETAFKAHRDSYNKHVAPVSKWHKSRNWYSPCSALSRHVTRQVHVLSPKMGLHEFRMLFGGFLNLITKCFKTDQKKRNFHHWIKNNLSHHRNKGENKKKLNTLCSQEEATDKRRKGWWSVRVKNSPPPVVRVRVDKYACGHLCVCVHHVGINICT